MTDDSHIFDRGLLQQRKTRAAPTIADFDFLLRRTAKDLVQRTGAMLRRFDTVVVLGAWHGVLSRKLAALDNVGTVISTDPCPALLRQCPVPRVQCHEEALPFARTQNFPGLDMIASALSLQLVNDLPGVLVQARRALRPDGLFLASLLGGNTLFELRDSLMRAEMELEGGASPRVAPFADVRMLGGLLQRAGLALPVTDSDLVTVTYDNMFRLLADLRGMGTTNVLYERRRTPLTRRILLRAAEIYSATYGTDDGRIRASFEIITLTAWAPHESQQKPLRPGSAQMRLAEALGTTEHTAGEAAGPGIQHGQKTTSKGES